MQQFGEIVRKEGKEDFEVDQERAVGAPFVLPSGGNPLNPQGRYLPVYPCYDRHIQEFRDSAEGVKQFLTGRLERTIAFSLSDGMVEAVASGVARGLESYRLRRREEGARYPDLGPVRTGWILHDPARQDGGNASVRPPTVRASSRTSQGSSKGSGKRNWKKARRRARASGRAVSRRGDRGGSRLGLLQGMAVGISDLDVSTATRR